MTRIDVMLAGPDGHLTVDGDFWRRLHRKARDGGFKLGFEGLESEEARTFAECLRNGLALKSKAKPTMHPMIAKFFDQAREKPLTKAEKALVRMVLRLCESEGGCRVEIQKRRVG